MRALFTNLYNLTDPTLFTCLQTLSGIIVSYHFDMKIPAVENMAHRHLLHHSKKYLQLQICSSNLRNAMATKLYGEINE